MVGKETYSSVYSKALDLLVQHPFDYVPILLFRVFCVTVLLILTYSHSTSIMCL